MVRGVQQVCLSNDCIAKMVRSPPGCYPQYFIDGIESTAYFARHTPPHDVEGIEIYRGSSETPGEFEGSNSGGGVIVTWTKAAPGGPLSPPCSCSPRAGRAVANAPPPRARGVTRGCRTA